MNKRTRYKEKKRLKEQRQREKERRMQKPKRRSAVFGGMVTVSESGVITRTTAANPTIKAHFLVYTNGICPVLTDGDNYWGVKQLTQSHGTAYLKDGLVDPNSNEVIAARKCIKKELKSESKRT